MIYNELQSQLNKAGEAINTRNFDESERLISEVIAELDNTGGTDVSLTNIESLRAYALLLRANVFQKRGDYDRAIDQGLQILALTKDSSHNDTIAKVYNFLGIMYKTIGDYDKALEYNSKALSEYKLSGDKKSIGGSIVNIGNVYNQLGMYDQALDCFLEAIPIFDEIGEKTFKANATMSIGIVYIHLGNYQKALEYYFQALEEQNAHGTKLERAQVTGNIGSVYFELTDYDKALEYYSIALAAFEELNAKEMVARFTGNMGSVYYEIGDFDKALEYNTKALGALRELGVKSSEAIVLGSIGTIYSNQNFAGYNSERAEEFFLQSIALSEETGAKHELYYIYKALANLHKVNKRWEEFAEYFEKFYAAEKEVQSEEAQKNTEQMEYRRKIEESERDRQVKLARFQEQEKILHNILPSQIADRMIDGEKTIADSHENVSVFFSDIVGFTKLSQRVSAEELVGMLNGIFTQFDQLARKHGLEKIKTIGDAYMAVCGAPVHVENHAERTALFAVDVAEFMNNYQANTGDKVMIRIGLHSGSVVAGIIGENKFAYDMWGDAVNTASRMESHGEAGKIHVSEEFKHAVETLHATSLQAETLHATSLQFIRRGEMDIKGKGKMKTYFLEKA